VRPALAAALASAAAALVAVAPAHAFSPTTPDIFSLSGPITLGQGPLPPLTCTANLMVSNTSNLVLSVSFTGSIACSSIVVTHMNWGVIQDPLTPKVTITNMALNTPVASCPPTSVVGAWSNIAPGTMTVPLTPMSSTCRIISATLSASPAKTLP
jgi:hypothetical protein